MFNPTTQIEKKRKFSTYNEQIQTSFITGLTIDEIQQFKQKGFILLKNAFSPETARKCRYIVWEKLKSKHIDPNDPSTWVKRIGLTDIYMENEGEPWRSVFTCRLKRAVDQLCGSNRWKEFGCGWWVITFPHMEPSPWGASGSWHIDGAHYQHHINSQESGLVPIFLFSSINKEEGGTALCTGSHKVTAQILCKHEPRGLQGKALSTKVHEYLVKNDLFDRNIVEINGDAGDVMLTHPFLLHARSKNLGNKGMHSVRFMCNPNVELRCSMRFPRRIHKFSDTEEKRKDLSVLETSILDAITEKLL